VPNRTALTHEEIQELLGAHALDAVDADERAIVDAHLATCDACRNEVAQHHETLALLINPVEPSADLRGAVLAGATSPRAAADAPVVSIDAARASRAGRGRRVAAILAAAAAVVVVVGIGFAVGRRTGSPNDLVALAAQAESQPDSHQVTLRSPDGTVDARVTETVDGTGYLHSEQLPALPPDQTYQLWAFSGPDGKTPISLGVLGTNPTLSTFRADADVTGFAVSREAGGGAVAPTTVVLS
jgi:anti-sigma-K factor RskA